MRAIFAGVVLVLAGCGTIRYQGTEEQMQEVARGAAELMKKDPYSNAVGAAAKVAHMVAQAANSAADARAAAEVEAAAQPSPLASADTPCYRTRTCFREEVKAVRRSLGKPTTGYLQTETPVLGVFASRG